MAEAVNQTPREYVEIFTGLNRLYEENRNNPDAQAFTAWLKLLKDMLEMDTSGIPVIFINLGNSPELVLALGENDGEVITSGFEGVGCLQAWFGNNEYNNDIIDFIEAKGLPSYVCSADKLPLGYMMKQLVAPPVGSVFTSAPCDSQIVGAEGLKSILGVEPFIVSIPYGYGEKELQYVSNQLREAIKYLERVTGKKLNWERLKAICEENNRMVDHLLEWYEIRKNVPCPQMSKVCSFGFALINSFSGTAGGTWYASELAKDAKERAIAGKKAVPGEEKFRAIWYGDPVFWDVSFYDWMEEELGMVVPMDLFGYISPDAYIDTSSPDAILYSLARKYTRVMPMSRQLIGSAERYIDELISVVNEFKADCVIFPCNTGCKHMWGMAGLVREALREADIPMLEFHFDVFDPRTLNIEDMKEVFRRFVNDIMLPRLSAKNR